MDKIKKIKQFYKLWIKCNTLYGEICPKKHMAFPEPLQKMIVNEYVDEKLKPSANKSYDYEGNVELKSVTMEGGVSTFKKSQNRCKRIIYLEILTTGIFYWDITDESILENINGRIDKEKKDISINLKKFLKNAQRMEIKF